MFTLTKYNTAPSARKAAARTPACEGPELADYLQQCETVKRERYRSVRDLETYLDQIRDRGGATWYTDRMEMEILADLLSTTDEDSCTLIHWSAFIIRRIEARPDAACFELVIDILRDEIEQLRLLIKSARACKKKIRRMLAEGRA